MPFFALLKRSKIAREQSAEDRDGGERPQNRSKRGVLRELFRWNAGVRREEKREDIEGVCMGLVFGLVRDG